MLDLLRKTFDMLLQEMLTEHQFYVKNAMPLPTEGLGPLKDATTVIASEAKRSPEELRGLVRDSATRNGYEKALAEPITTLSWALLME